MWRHLFMGRHLFVFFALLGLLSGCKKEADPKPDTSPLIQPKICNLIKSSLTNGGFTTYEYDSNSRIKSLRQYIPASNLGSERKTYYTFNRDANNRVTEIVGGTESASAIKKKDEFEYDSKGRWIKTTTSSIPASSAFSVTVPEYNSQGLIEKITYTYHSGSSAQVRLRTYEYKDGNLNSLRDVEGNRITTTNFEYYLDRPSRISELDSLHSYYLSLGSLSKNMLKTVRTFDQANVMETTYTYVFMDPDYVQGETSKTLLNGAIIGNSEAINTYNCK